MTTSLYTALDIAKCVRQGEHDQPIFDCHPHEAYETLKVLRDEVLRLQRVENENIALATANSELRSEVLRIKNRVREINSLPWSSDTVDALADFVEDWQ